jgi:multiple sugar transport system permease protein
MTPAEKRNLCSGLLFVLPWLVGLVVFNAWPLLKSFYYSLCQYSVLTPPVFIGGANYRDLLTDDLFIISLRNTLVYAAFALPLGLVISLALALMLNCRIVMRPVFRGIIFFPSLVPLVVLAIIWRGMFDTEYGIINYLLGLAGIDGPNWLGDPRWTKMGIVFMTMWGVGNIVVIYLAGLQDVPRVLYEACDIDGANTWQRIRHVTLPMISPTIYFNLIMSCIFILQIFVQPFLVFDGRGGPDQSCLFYTMYLVDQAFVYLRMGYACAMAWVLFILIACLTYSVHRLAERHVHYGGA